MSHTCMHAYCRIKNVNGRVGVEGKEIRFKALTSKLSKCDLMVAGFQVSKCVQ